MSKKFDWKQIPKNYLGYVDYQQIPSPVVRKMVGESEQIKLQEEYKARMKWTWTEENKEAVKKIGYQLQRIADMFFNLDRAEGP